MKKSKERVLQAINHRSSDCVPVDFGSSAVTGIHCKVVEQLRDYYGLEKKPVRVSDVYQMLGEVDAELAACMGVDCIGVGGTRDLFGMDNTRLHEQTTPWGQKVLVPEDLDMTPKENGNVYAHPQGDKESPASGMLPEGGYFFDAIERQQPFEESELDPEDNLEEYGYLTDADLEHFKNSVDKAYGTGRAVVASFGGAALGDIAFIPGTSLKEPKGIRSVAEWYMSTIIRQDYIHQIYEKQTDIAIANYEKLWKAVGDKVDVVFTCGADFGTQDSQFCSVDVFNELWLPHYKRMNDWIHNNTTWKTMKHSCGAIYPLIPSMIEAGFDILNPVQISARDMEPRRLKAEFGSDVVFWGGGVDTQKVLQFGTPDEVRRQVMEQCEIMGRDGGFVFNTIHNLQATVPFENILAMLKALEDIRK